MFGSTGIYTNIHRTCILEAVATPNNMEKRTVHHSINDLKSSFPTVIIKQCLKV